MTLVEMLKRDEGSRRFPYKDSLGTLTIGVGRNLDDVGLSDDEIEYILMNDIRRATEEAKKYDWYKELDRVRKDVVICMIFNLGPTGFAGFKNTIADIAAKNYESAASRMLQSKWSTQVGNRAYRLAAMMRSGAPS